MSAPLHCCDPLCSRPASFWLIDVVDCSPDGGDSTEMCADHVEKWLRNHHLVIRMADGKKIREAHVTI